MVLLFKATFATTSVSPKVTNGVIKLNQAARLENDFLDNCDVIMLSNEKN